MKKNNTGHGHLLVIIAAIIAITLSIAMFTFTPSLAKKLKTDPKDTTIKKSKYYYKSITIDSNGNRKEITKEATDPLDEKDANDSSNVTIHVTKKDHKKTNNDEDDDEDVSIDSSVSTYGSSPKLYFSYKEIDEDEFKNTMAQAMAEAGKAMAEAGKELASIDWEQNKKEMDKAMAEASKAMAEASKQVNAVDWNKIKAEIDKGIAEMNKELNDPKLRKEINEDMRKGLEKSKEALKKAEKEINKQHEKISAGDVVVNANSTSFDDMVKQMNADGLINSSGSYSIKKENNALFINGKKQPDDVYKKYRHFLTYKKVTIKGGKGDMNINISN